jgi:hypothetical protein
MMTPDSETRARVWKFQIAQNIFLARPRGYAHVRSKDFGASLLLAGNRNLHVS